jgi:DNA-binding PadR family transcriptional regulator
MDSTQQDPESMLPLTPAIFQILVALSDGREQHGYSIMQKIAADIGPAIGPTTLYRSIKRMLEAGLIEETGERPDPELDDERRRYYRLTLLGRQVLREEVLRLEQLIKIARKTPAFGQTLPGLSYGGA